MLRAAKIRKCRNLDAKQNRTLLFGFNKIYQFDLMPHLTYIAGCYRCLWRIIRWGYIWIMIGISMATTIRHMRMMRRISKGSPKKISFDKLGILSQPGGGVCPNPNFFCKIVKTKLTFVNGQKCDETHNT